ncbi:binding-protein-dependent transport system inner membrane protein [Caballeronia fortuita]|uniref:Binding-protein-dependent transport system inner membrane protein n=1 Tax=Caballeronia fortuita TaxID=1777138 RepID=A0A158C960_9BURK|nr:ABC transporter permease [Caballeronia fortuita]SAK78839.1 binding-protein-dependent transport system inner membrane protein [Caballeronia fortuita]
MAKALTRVFLPADRGREASSKDTLRTIGWTALPWIVPVLCALLWTLGSRYGWISAQVLPSPALVFDTLGALVKSGDLWMHLSASMTRAAVGFGGGVLLGIALGGLLGLSRTLEAYVLPSFNAIVQVPVLGWLPFLMIVVGIGEPLKYLLIGHAALVPVTLSTLQGFRGTPRALQEVASVYRYSRWQVVTRVTLPAAIPVIGTGVRLAFTKAWLTLVVVELVASSEGLGYLIVYGRQLFQLDLVLAAVLIVGAIGYAADRLLNAFERKLQRGRNN